MSMNPQLLDLALPLAQHVAIDTAMTARLTGLDESVIVAARKRGDLHAFKIGRRWLHRPMHVLEWIARCEDAHIDGKTVCYRARTTERRS